MKIKRWLAISIGIIFLGLSTFSFACEICDMDYCSDTWNCDTDSYYCSSCDYDSTYTVSSCGC